MPFEDYSQNQHVKSLLSFAFRNPFSQISPIQVMLLWGSDELKLVPVGGEKGEHKLAKIDATSIRGFYQYRHQFYNKKLESIVPWEMRYTARIWECTL